MLKNFRKRGNIAINCGRISGWEKARLAVVAADGLVTCACATRGPTCPAKINYPCLNLSHLFPYALCVPGFTHSTCAFPSSFNCYSSFLSTIPFDIVS